MKILMQAPEGTTGSTIQGQPYEPDEDGQIVVSNPNHIEDLEMHGYTLVTEGADESKVEADEEPETEKEEAEVEQPEKKKKKRKKNR